MMGKRNRSATTILRMEIDTARRVVEAAEKSLAITERALKTLKVQEKNAVKTLAELQTRTDAGPKVKQSISKTKREIRQIKTMRRRNEKLVKKLKPAARDKRRRLQRLERQANLFSSEIKALHGRTPAIAPEERPVTTGEQLRGARAMLGMSQSDFAQSLGISSGVLRGLEKVSGEIANKDDLLGEIRNALARLGIDLIGPGLYVGAGGPGVRLRAQRARGELIKRPKKSLAAKRKPRRRKAARAA